MREFVYGVLFGAVVMFGYERLEPGKILDYLNSATASAVRSTSGYGGTHKSN